MVATGKGNRQSYPLELAGETEPIEPADEPAAVVVTDIEGKAKNEMKEAMIESSLEAEILKAHIPEVQQWDTVSRRLYKGKGWTQITDKLFPNLSPKARESKAKAIENAVKAYRQEKENNGQK